MSGFWSAWVIVLLVLNLGVALFLFVWAQVVRIPTEPDGTTGHVWAHGVLREGVRTLPLWWVVSSVIALLAALIYFVFYPGFGGYRGVLGWTSVDELRADTQANNARLEARLQSFRPMSPEQLAMNEEARSMGQRLYEDNCAACHGVDARGNQLVGAPDLTDTDALYGNDVETLQKSILDGRNGVMPPWGAALGYEGSNEVAAWVLTYSGVASPAGWAEAGKARFESMCVACHGADGRGNRAQGVPDLTDKVWLYGSDFASIASSIRDGRNGVMPAWSERLSQDEVRLVVAWILSQHRSGPPGE